MADESPKPGWTVPRRGRCRARTACAPCRARKSKCDKAKPACSICKSRGHPQQCIYRPYSPEPRRALLPKASFNPTRRATLPSEPHVSDANIAALNQRASEPGQPVPSKPCSFGRIPRSNLTDLPPNKEGLEEDASQDETTFGHPSTYSFIHRVAAVVEPNIKQQSSSCSPALSQKLLTDPIGFTVSSNSRENLILDIGSVSLPEKQLADSLMQAFWDYSHPIFPVLHRPSFTKRYENLWKPSEALSLPRYTGDDVLLLALVNVVMAIGCQRCEVCPGGYKNHDAESLYRKSVRLISAETLDTYSFETAQLFLLRAIYLQYTSFASRCWSTLGIAQRVVYGLRLHENRPGANQLRREMSRRLWYIYRILDSIASYTFGWATTRYEPNLIPLPEAIDDGYLLEEGEGCQPAGMPSRLDFLLPYIKMAEPSREIAERIHSIGQRDLEPRSTAVFTQYISEMPRICLQLDELLDTLPHHLKALDDENIDPCFRMQGRVIRSRTQYVKVTILRPCLLASVGSYATRTGFLKKHVDGTSLTTTLLDSINRLCISTALTIISEMHKSLHTMYRASTWHMLRAAFGSATVLLAASLLPDAEVDLDVDPSRTAWEQVIAIFEFYTSYDASARNGINALWDYRKRFAAAKTQGQQPFQNGLNQTRQPDPASQSPVASANNNTLSFGDLLFPGNNRLFAFEDQGLYGDFSQSISELDYVDLGFAEFFS